MTPVNCPDRLGAIGDHPERPLNPGSGPPDYCPSAVTSHRLHVTIPIVSTAEANLAATPRPPLLRPRRGRVFAGVCAAVASHLGLSVKAVRWAFLALSLALGAGVLLYLWLALLVPAGEASDIRQPRLARLVPALRQRSSTGRLGQVTLAIVLLVIAATLWAMRSGLHLSTGWMVPVIVVLCGAGLAWSQLDAIERQDTPAATSRSAVLVRVGGGVALAVVGVVMLVGQGQGAVQVLRGIIAGLAVLSGAALVLAPWWLRLWRELIAERAARARESERADIAAHLHDSVLQTLSLIRSRSTDPAMVQRLARAQERELRHWLYQDRPEPGDSIADELRSEERRVGKECRAQWGRDRRRKKRQQHGRSEGNERRRPR